MIIQTNKHTQNKKQTKQMSYSLIIRDWLIDIGLYVVIVQNHRKLTLYMPLYSVDSNPNVSRSTP